MTTALRTAVIIARNAALGRLVKEALRTTARSADRARAGPQCSPLQRAVLRALPATAAGNGNAVLYFTCFNAKLDLMLETPGIFAR